MRLKLLILSSVLTAGGVMFGVCAAISCLMLYVFGSGVGSGISLLVFLWAAGSPKDWNKVWDHAEEAVKARLDRESS